MKPSREGSQLARLLGGVWQVHQIRLKLAQAEKSTTSCSGITKAAGPKFYLSTTLQLSAAWKSSGLVVNGITLLNYPEAEYSYTSCHSIYKHLLFAHVCPSVSLLLSYESGNT